MSEQLAYREPPYDTERDETGATRCPPFAARAVEAPGGGRIRNKAAPRAADLATVSGLGGKEIRLHRLAATAWQALVCDARNAGIRAPLLLPVSGFRDPVHQKRLWDAALDRYGSASEARKWVAPPGSSPHQSGRAIDFYLGGTNSSGNVAHLSTLPAYKWLATHARRFGFYPYEREPWHWEYNPPSTGTPNAELAPVADRAAPALLSREHTPPQTTLYLDIKLGAESPARPMTGVFLPRGWKPQATVDVLLYLHGIKEPGLTIDRYWKQAHFALREKLNESGKNVILAAPTLGPRSQRQIGSLAQPGGLDAYLDSVLAGVAAYGAADGSRVRPRLGNLILAAHSGGGLPMRLLALSKNRVAANIKECWGFDCTYFSGDETEWTRWARAHPSSRLFIYYIANSPTAARSTKLAAQNVPNVTVVASADRRHYWVPLSYWRERLQGARFLAQVPGDPDEAPDFGTRLGAQEVQAVATGAGPSIRTTTQLRKAWRAYECAEHRMVPLRLFGWNTPVNLVTVDAWRALEQALVASGYRAHRAWVYICRDIGGQTTRSLHAYGLAIDIDHTKPTCNVNRATPDNRPVRFSSAATKEKRCQDVRDQRADTSFTPDQVAAVEAIRTVDGHQVFAWGGRWRTTKDTMHFQINVTPEELARGIRADSVRRV